VFVRLALAVCIDALAILRWAVVMAICFNQLVSHCAVILRIIPNSGRRNSAMVFKGQLKSSKPLSPRCAIQAHNPVLFIGE